MITYTMYTAHTQHIVCTNCAARWTCATTRQSLEWSIVVFVWHTHTHTRPCYSVRCIAQIIVFCNYNFHLDFDYFLYRILRSSISIVRQRYLFAVAISFALSLRSINRPCAQLLWVACVCERERYSLIEHFYENHSSMRCTEIRLRPRSRLRRTLPPHCWLFWIFVYIVRLINEPWGTFILL